MSAQIRPRIERLKRHTAMFGQETIKAIDELRQQVEALESGLDDPSVKNWLTMACLALENA
jgi:hypothetical protein